MTLKIIILLVKSAVKECDLNPCLQTNLKAKMQKVHTLKLKIFNRTQYTK